MVGKIISIFSEMFLSVFLLMCESRKNKGFENNNNKKTKEKKQMKNLKNTATAIALATVLMVGTASASPEASAETITQDAPQLTKCTVTDTNVIKGIVGSFINQILLSMPRAFFAPQIVVDNEAQNCGKNDSISTD